MRHCEKQIEGTSVIILEAIPNIQDEMGADRT